MRVGTIVRVELGGRRVRGWVVDLDDSSEVEAARLKPLAKVTGAGPPPGVVDLARWAAWRWAGRPAHLLRVASPPGVVGVAAGGAAVTPGSASTVRVVRVGPGADRLALVLDAVAAADGRALVVVPEVAAAERLARRLRRDGRRVALLAGDVTVGEWAAAASGAAVVVGTRVAVWAPTPDGWLRSVVVLDEHDEALQSEQAPTWHARDVAVERAARDGASVVLVSPVPTLHARALVEAVEAAPGAGAWPAVEVADRRDEDPVRGGPFSPALERALRSSGEQRVVCVLNRLGRSRLLACAACGEVAACERCGAHVVQPVPEVLRCAACELERPPVCLHCGGGRFKNLRRGVTRIREELEVLAGEPVAEVTAETDGDARILVGTEAVLHRLPAGSAGIVAFLDLDQELLAPRYRAAEQALALVARAARALGPKGRLLLQTRMPEHPVVQAARRHDPDLLAAVELDRRRQLGFPPAAAVAQVSGAAAPAWAAAAAASARPLPLDAGSRAGVPGAPAPPGPAAAPGAAVARALPLGVEVLGPADGAWLVRAPTPGALADFLASVPRPAGRLRVAVDPPRL